MINIDTHLSNADWPKRTNDRGPHLDLSSPPTSLYRDKLKALQLDWDEGEHPRADDGKFTDGSGGDGSGGDGRGGEYATSPDAPRGGDGQQALFEYAPESGSEAHLRLESARGIKEVEALLPAAVKDANYDAPAVSWDDLKRDEQAAARDHFVHSVINDSGASDEGYAAGTEYVNEHLTDADVHTKVMEDGFASDFSTEADGRELDPNSVEGVWEHGEFALDPSGLKYADGTPVSGDDAEIAGRLYARQSEQARQALSDDLRQSDEAIERSDAASLAYAESEWGAMTPDAQLEYAQDHNIVQARDLKPGLPKTWTWDSQREEADEETNEDYLRTRAIGLELVKDRTEALMKARGVFSAAMTPENVSDSLWQAWKEDSQSGLGISMQIAAAKELGTLPTASLTEDDRNRANDLMVESLTTREEKRALNPTVYSGERGSNRLLRGRALAMSPEAEAKRNEQFRLQEEGDAKLAVIAESRVRAYVRAQWETTQFLLEKAGTTRVQVHRAIIRPIEEVQATKQEIGADGIRLPEYRLLQNAVASATTKPKVANEWNGVGVKVEHGKRERVVLRFDVPRTAVLSLPVYGQNVHAESEVVLIGTKGLKWDAWLQKGPGFNTRRIDMASFKLEVTVESDDTPEKTAPAKKDGPVIDLLKDQDKHWLHPEHYDHKTRKTPPPTKPETK